MVLQICGLCGCSRFAVADFRPREQYPALDRGEITGGSRRTQNSGLLSQEKQIEQYTTEIEEMDRRIRMLRSDRDTLEKFARENFHFSEPGDDVYILDE